MKQETEPLITAMNRLCDLLAKEQVIMLKRDRNNPEIVHRNDVASIRQGFDNQRVLFEHPSQNLSTVYATRVIIAPPKPLLDQGIFNDYATDLFSYFGMQQHYPFCKREFNQSDRTISPKIQFPLGTLLQKRQQTTSQEPDVHLLRITIVPHELITALSDRMQTVTHYYYFLLHSLKHEDEWGPERRSWFASPYTSLEQEANIEFDVMFHVYEHAIPTYLSETALRKWKHEKTI